MAGDEGLSEALLPRDGTAEALDGAAAQQQVTVHRPFDLDFFLRFVWERWLGLLREFESGAGGLGADASCILQEV